MTRFLRIIISFSYVFVFCSETLAQEIPVNIGSIPKMVPEGKKWVLKRNQTTLIELSSLSLKDGNLCNVQLRSSSRNLGFLVEGDLRESNNAFQFFLSEFEKEPFRGFSIYRIEVSIFLDRNGNNIDEITFFPGEQVYTSLCIESIQLYESDLSESQKIYFENKSMSEEEKQKEQNEKNEIKRKYIEEVQSKVYNLEEVNPRIYEAVLENHRTVILYVFNKGKGRSVSTYGVPSYEDLELSKVKFRKFNGEYSIKYLIPIFKSPHGENIRDYVKEIKSKTPSQYGVNPMYAAITPINNIKIDGIPVETEVVIDNINIDIFRGIVNVQVDKNGKVKFFDRIPVENYRVELEKYSKNLEKGKYLIKYQFSNIIGKDFIYIEEKKK